jgi:hypothetical protein
MAAQEEAGDVKAKLYCVDASQYLIESWLNNEISKAGCSRLITGDPGTGKSTFSLMLGRGLSEAGWRVLYIQANSIRSLELSLPKIVSIHLQRTLHLENAPTIDAELWDPDGTGKPLLIILDGLDEYDSGAATVSIAAARLVEHCLTVVDEWNSYHPNAVRLLLCGRPESASSLTARFREVGHHIHITGFLTSRQGMDEFANKSSEERLAIDQREDWWAKWQRACNEPETGLPDTIRKSSEQGVQEITAQPLLNYMMAVLKLYDARSLTNLSSLYGALFARYYERQSMGKSGTFEKLCPSLERFQRIMSEIGLAAWHAGDRSVSVEDLKGRFDTPPLKSWFDAAGHANSGLGAILSAFYTRPEDAANPESGLAQRYVFTHKSFREYLTGVGLVRFIRKLTDQLHPDAEDGWSDKRALTEWLELFGPTALDQRQWQFLVTEVQAVFANDMEGFLSVKDAVERLFGLILERKMPVPAGDDLGFALRYVGNAEEAAIGVLSAIRKAADNVVKQVARRIIEVRWPKNDSPDSGGEFALRELVSRSRARPGAPDEFILCHIWPLLEKGGEELNGQVSSSIRRRADGWDYASTFDFTGMNVQRANLKGASLFYSRWHRANISGVKLDYCDLNQSDLNYAEANLHRRFKTSFRNASLLNCRFVHARIKADFQGAHLGGADLRSFHYDDSNLEEADTPGVVFGEAYYRRVEEPVPTSNPKEKVKARRKEPRQEER